MINFIFFGRLEYSKWIDLIIDFIFNYPDFCKEKAFNFYIFWDWGYAREIENLENKFDFVRYFWWQSKDLIKKYLRKSDFTLMPSRFLETFGLSALESLAEWIPVIWFKKWGLKQFVFDELDVLNYKQFLKQLQTIWNTVIDNEKKYYEFIACDYKKDRLWYYFTNWFLKNDLWDKRNEKLKNYYRQKCITLAQEYKVEKWLENFYKIFKEE